MQNEPTMLGATIPARRGMPPAAGDALLLLPVFVAVRLLWHAAGLRFLAEPLASYWQYLPVDLLRDDLWRSLVHLHAQPPLFNLFLGLVLKAAGPWAPQAFHALYAGMGFGIVALVVVLLAACGVPRPLRLVAGAVLVCAPSAIGHEHWLFYPQPLALLMTVAALAAVRGAAGRRFGCGLFFFACAGIVLTRSLYHPLWFAGTLLLPRFAGKAPWRRIARAAALPAALIALVVAKNLVLFGTSSLSSWLGMSLDYRTTWHIPRAVLAREVAAGIASALALVRPFVAPEDYTPFVKVGTVGIPALDRLWKAPGVPNYNAALYLPVSRICARDALALAPRHPRVVLEYLLRAASNFLRPSTDNPLWGDNAIVLGGYARAWNAVTTLALASLGGRSAGFALFAVVSMVLCMLLLAGRLRMEAPVRALMLFATGTLLWAGVVGCVLALDETNRFPYPTEPRRLVLFAVAVGRRFLLRTRE